MIEKDSDNRFELPGLRPLVGLLTALMLTLFPGFSSLASEIEGPELVEPGKAEVEVGLTYEREENDEEDSNTFSFPEPLLKVGVFPNFELQAEGAGLIITDPDDGKSTSHGSDFTVMGKFGIAAANGFIPETAGFVVLSFPTGGEAVTSDGVDPTVILIGSWGLPHDMAFSVNLGFGAPTNGPEESNRFFEFSTVLNLEFPIRDGLVGFAEYFNSIANEGEADAHSLDVGLGYEFTQKISGELTAGAGLTEAAADYFFNFLLAFSF